MTVLISHKERLVRVECDSCGIGLTIYPRRDSSAHECRALVIRTAKQLGWSFVAAGKTSTHICSNCKDGVQAVPTVTQVLV